MFVVKKLECNCYICGHLKITKFKCKSNIQAAVKLAYSTKNLMLLLHPIACHYNVLATCMVLKFCANSTHCYMHAI